MWDIEGSVFSEVSILSNLEASSASGHECNSDSAYKLAVASLQPVTSLLDNTVVKCDKHSYNLNSAIAS
jgi:hypothetical protein